MPRETVVQAALPPRGSVEVVTSPYPLTATHNDAVGHEMPTSPSGPIAGSGARVHAVAPPDGSVDVRMSPPSSAAAQNEAVGHEMAVRFQDLEKGA